eukprot:762656-Hanusia_phi.AAC.2
MKAKPRPLSERPAGRREEGGGERRGGEERSGAERRGEETGGHQDGKQGGQYTSAPCFPASSSLTCDQRDMQDVEIREQGSSRHTHQGLTDSHLHPPPLSEALHSSAHQLEWRGQEGGVEGREEMAQEKRRGRGAEPGRGGEGGGASSKQQAAGRGGRGGGGGGGASAAPSAAAAGRGGGGGSGGGEEEEERERTSVRRVPSCQRR